MLVPRTLVDAAITSGHDANLLVQALTALTEGERPLMARRPRSLDDSDDEGVDDIKGDQANAAMRRPLVALGVIHSARNHLERHPRMLSNDLRLQTLEHLNRLQSMPVIAVEAGALRAAYEADSDSGKLLDLLLQLDCTSSAAVS